MWRGFTPDTRKTPTIRPTRQPRHLLEVTKVQPYYTITIYPTTPDLTNQWNAVPVGWPSMERGNFATSKAATDRASEILPKGAPFAVRLVTE